MGTRLIVEDISIVLTFLDIDNEQSAVLLDKADHDVEGSHEFLVLLILVDICWGKEVDCKLQVHQPCLIDLRGSKEITYTHGHYIKARRHFIRLLNADLPAREKARGHVPLDGLHLALGFVMIGNNTIVLFYHLSRFVNRKDLRDMRGDGLSPVSGYSIRGALAVTSQLI